jgi:MoxR-like ATPase
MSTLSTEQLQSEDLKSRVGRFREVDAQIVRQVRRVIVGQEEVLEQIMIGLFVGGHCLITGLPGTAKTLLVRTLAQTLGLIF